MEPGVTLLSPAQRPVPQRAILCFQCATPIEPNSANLCLACLRSAVDITEGLPKQAALQFCRNCQRYLSPPNMWQTAELESKELLAMCLKRLKGLSKVRLIDAGFIWTEPHSRRVRVKLTIQKEVFANTVLEQILEVEFVIQYQQCPDCTRLAAKNTWQSMVQVRQKVNHKRTFLYLEQLILRHHAHRDTVNIREAKDGLDFYYSNKQHALKMVDFLCNVVPVKFKASEQLISVDIHSSSSAYKFTYSVEIIPICKDDLVVLPPKLAASLGNIYPLTICTRVSNSLHLMDPASLQTADLMSPIYWRTPFDSLASTPAMIEFIVLDIEPTGLTRGKWVHADAQVARSNALSHAKTEMESKESKPLTKKEQRLHRKRERTSKTAMEVQDDEQGIPIDVQDVTASSVSNLTFHTRTHLGAILQPGDTVLGYFLSNTNFNHELYDLIEESQRPDVILIRKTYPRNKARSGTKRRNWKLKSIATEAEDPNAAIVEDERPKKGGKATQTGGVFGRGAIGRRGGNDTARVEADYEMFLRDLEEDPELRSGINLYKAAPGSTKYPKKVTQQGDMETDGVEIDDSPPDEAEGSSEVGDLDVGELLEDLEEMQLEDDEGEEVV